MHIYAFLSPIILAMLIAFARAIRLHPWVARIPSFGEMRMQPTASSNWRTALLSLAAFVILPLAAQIHFISQFHDKGTVYTDPERFGYEAIKLEAKGEKCYRNGATMCTKKGVDRYTRATPKTGFSADHWDNAYHYGNREEGRGSTVTYFPIVQPYAIRALSVLSAAMAAIVLFLVFRRTPDQIARNGKLGELLRRSRLYRAIRTLPSMSERTS
jgi:hypothetical protein